MASQDKHGGVVADRGPMLTAGRLWEKTSAAGRKHLVGRMGGVQVLVFENTRRDGDDTSTHSLMFGEATRYDPTRGIGPVGPESSPAPTASSHPARKSARRKEAPPPQQIDDDVVPF